MQWLKLVRLPTVFTAMADIFLGFLIVLDGQFKPVFGVLLAASSCLYFTGMVFNDVFDLKKDLEERPSRPIPSGAISIKAASTFGTVLCVAGVTLAAIASIPSAAIAVAIVVAVFAYDWLLKPTPLAPIAMGSCRFLNVLLGASMAGGFSAIFAPPQVVIAAMLGLYIAGLTWFARKEAVGENRRDLIGGSVVMVGAVLALAGYVVMNSTANRKVAYLLTFMAAVVGTRLVRAVRSGQPADIGAGIRTALLSLVLIDASLVLAFTGSIMGAVATAALLIPASVIRKWIPLT